MVVLDTSALLYWTLAPDKLSASAADAIDTAQRVVISSISLLGCPLITSDLEIRSFYAAAIW